MTGGARLAATLFPRLAGLGFGSWAPLGGQRERWHRPQRTQAARGLRLECEDGDGAGRAGGRTREWAPPAAKRKPSPAEARGGRPTLRGALPSTAPWRGLGGDRKQWHGRSAAEPVPTAWPPGGRMGQSTAPERGGGAWRRPTGGKQMAPRAGRGSPEGWSPSTARTAASGRGGEPPAPRFPRPLQRSLSGGAGSDARRGRAPAVSGAPHPVLGCTWLGWETAWRGTSNTPMSSRRGGTP